MIQLLRNLFVHRGDVHAEMFISKGRAGFKLVEEPLTDDRLTDHIDGKVTIGTYQLGPDSTVVWGCADFDLNTVEDLENAKKLYDFVKENDYHSLLEMSGGGEFKAHVWVFSKEHVQARAMQVFMRFLCDGANVSPHEIFPKQIEITVNRPYGNLVKLPLGINLKTGERSVLLDDDFKPITDSEKIKERFQYHLDNRDTLPRLIEKETLSHEPPQSAPAGATENASEFDAFFNFVLCNELPQGISVPDRKYPKIEGINSNILKNEAIWLKQRGYDQNRMEKEIRPIFERNGWAFPDLLGWFRKAESGEIDEINAGELVLWCRTYLPELLPMLPKIDDSWKRFFKCVKVGKDRDTGNDKFSYTFVPKWLGDHILKSEYFKTVEGSKEMYHYRDGLYRNNGRERLQTLIKDLLGNKFKTHHSKETLAYIEASTMTDPKESNNNFLNFENGLFDLSKMEFCEHTPKIFSITRLPYNYDPDAKAEVFLEKLKGKVSETKVQTLQEMFGYCLLPGQRFEVAFLFYGPRRTMKSTTLFACSRMLGIENITAYALKYLNEDKFAMAYLFGKLANICPDLPASALKDVGPFMVLTGGDPVTFARKGGHPMTWFPSTKLLFSCNQIPSTSNKDLAYYRRIFPIEFSKTTPKEEIDSKMKDKILGELSGLFNWAIEGLKRILENDGFSNRPDEYEVKDVYEKNANSVDSFIYNCIDAEDDEGKITKREVYKKYTQYCRDNRLRAENITVFGTAFKNTTGCGGTTINKIPAYVGVSFKDSGGERQTSLPIQ